MYSEKFPTSSHEFEEMSWSQDELAEYWQNSHCDNDEIYTGIQRKSHRQTFRDDNNSVVDTRELEWQKYAHCKGVDRSIFFPYMDEQRSHRQMSQDQHDEVLESARQYCDYCSVASECRNYALDNEKFGIWAGDFVFLMRRNRRSK